MENRALIIDPFLLVGYLKRYLQKTKPGPRATKIEQERHRVAVRCANELSRQMMSGRIEGGGEKIRLAMPAGGEPGSDEAVFRWKRPPSVGLRCITKTPQLCVRVAGLMKEL